jgi:hypothetical protein
MARCDCLCHHEWRGEQRAAAHAGRFLAAFEFAQMAAKVNGAGVEDADVLEAAVACAACLAQHCEALRTHPRRPRIVPQADGWSGETGG